MFRPVVHPPDCIWRVVVLTLCFAWGLGAPSVSLGEPSSDDDPLGGASRPRPYNVDPAPADGQYKRIHQYALKRIVQGEASDAIEYLHGILKELPDDAESYYVLAVAYAQTGRLDRAETCVNKAIDLGTPPGRFLAGPRELLRPIHATRSYQELLEKHQDRPIHGPMVGAVTDRAAKVWVRAAAQSDVTVEFSETGDVEQARTAGPVEATEETDYTAVVPLDGLKPNTVYYYRVTVGAGEAGPRHRFKTYQSEGNGTKLRLAFGGGAGWVPPHERMWNTILSFEPQALLLLGDNVYSDDPETPEIQRYCYYRRHSRPEWRSLVAATPVFAIWDDHDFGTDDSWGGPLIDAPAWKRPVWNVFRQNWVNPAYGGGEQQPGCWFDFTIGDIHFIMLDGRYYRTDAGRFGGDGVAEPSMLGPVQKQWLKDRLETSRATFKVLVSPVPWDFRAKLGRSGLDTWRGYAEEREEIFSFIEDRQIEGVVLMSADRHRSDAWHIERPHGYDFFEFNSSRLTNQHRHKTMDAAIFSYNAKQSFGLVTFDTTVDDPSVTYDVVNIDGETVHSLRVNRSQLTFGSGERHGRHAESQQVRYVAPEARGDGSGDPADNAARWTDSKFWDNVKNWLNEGDLLVYFLEGTYFVSGQQERNLPQLSLSRLGHPTHRLTLQGMTDEGVTITRHPSDGTRSREGTGLLRLNRCRNMTLRHLHFTAPDNHWMSYATQFDRCENLLIDSCSWIDMPNVHHGATGAHREETDNVIYKNCKFIRIGRRGGAHMAYNAYAPRRISYINCYFEDCAGDYIRFRSGADFGVVAGCTFRSTGSHVNTHMPFISVPLFNNVDPGDEFFGTHFLIFNNEFIYETEEVPAARIAVRFFHRGFDPPDRRHLLDTEEAEVLKSGSTEEKKALLKKNLGVDTDQVRVYDNRYTNVAHRGVYQFDAAYGAASRGGDGRYDISDTFNAEPAVTSAEEAPDFFGAAQIPELSE